MPDEGDAEMALLEAGGKRSDEEVGHTTISSAGGSTAIRSAAASFFPLLVLIPIGALVSDMSSIWFLASSGNITWCAVQAVTLCFAWRAVTLYMATRPVLTRDSIIAVLVPGGAPELVARVAVSRIGTTATGGGGNEDVKLQLLYETMGEVPLKPTEPPKRRRSKQLATTDLPARAVGDAVSPAPPEAGPWAPSPSSPPSPLPSAPGDEDNDDGAYGLNYEPPPKPPNPASSPPPRQDMAAMNGAESCAANGMANGSAGSSPPAAPSRPSAGTRSGSPAPAKAIKGFFSRRGPFPGLSGRAERRPSIGARRPSCGVRAASPIARRPSCGVRAASPTARRPSCGVRGASPICGVNAETPITATPANEHFARGFGRSLLPKRPGARRHISPPAVSVPGNDETAAAGGDEERDGGPQAALAQLNRSRLDRRVATPKLVRDTETAATSPSAHGFVGARVRQMLEEHAAVLTRADHGAWCARASSVAWFELRVSMLALLIGPSLVWRACIALLLAPDTPAPSTPESPSADASEASPSDAHDKIGSANDGGNGGGVALQSTKSSMRNSRAVSSDEASGVSPLPDHKAVEATTAVLHSCRVVFLLAGGCEGAPQLLLRVAMLIRGDGAPTHQIIAAALSLSWLAVCALLLFCSPGVHNKPHRQRASGLVMELVAEARRQSDAPKVDTRALLDALLGAYDAGAVPDELSDGVKRLVACRIAHVRELKRGSFSAGVALSAGALPNELRAAGYSAAEVHTASTSAVGGRKFGAADLRQAGFPLGEVRELGFGTAEMRAAGYSARGMRLAEAETPQRLRGMPSSNGVTSGFSQATELKKAGFTAADLRDAHYNGRQLRSAGYTAGEMYDSDFSALSLYAAGYAADEVATAGFHPSELRPKPSVAPAPASPPPIISTPALAEKAVGSSSSTISTVSTSIKSTPMVVPTFDAVAIAAAEQRAIEHGEQRPLYTYDELVMAIVEVKTAGCGAKKLREVGFSCAELKAAEFTLSELRDAGFPPPELMAAGFPPNRLRVTGFSAIELRDQCSLSLADLHVAGYTATQLKAAGYTLKEISVRATATQMHAAGYSFVQLCGVGYSNSQLRVGGYTAVDMVAGGLGVTELLAAGYRPAEVVAAGFSADAVESVAGKKEQTRKSITELKQLQGRSLQEMLDAGLSTVELKAEGVTATQLREAGKDVKELIFGYSAAQLRMAGFSAADLRRADVVPSKIKKAGFPPEEVKAALLLPVSRPLKTHTV